MLKYLQNRWKWSNSSHQLQVRVFYCQKLGYLIVSMFYMKIEAKQSLFNVIVGIVLVAICLPLVIVVILSDSKYRCAPDSI